MHINLVEGGNMTGGVSYNIPVHHFGQQAPIQNAQDQWTYQGMAHAVYTVLFAKIIIHMPRCACAGEVFISTTMQYVFVGV